MVDKYGEDESTHPMVDPDIWREVSGPNKKGRVRGLGKTLSIGSSSSCATTFRSARRVENEEPPVSLGQVQEIVGAVSQKFDDFQAAMQ
jgi:hypothetical protein